MTMSCQNIDERNNGSLNLSDLLEKFEVPKTEPTITTLLNHMIDSISQNSQCRNQQQQP